MKITTLTIRNYRNLDGLTIQLNPNCNFIVGENNLGKSNFLHLFQTLFTGRTFRSDDFRDPSVPIEIDFSLKLDESEIGNFEDLFDEADISIINIVASQTNADDNISFLHKETETYIPVSSIRVVNDVHYDSIRNPLIEINFDKGKGVGKFLRSIVARYLETSEGKDTDYVDRAKLSGLIEKVNDTISRIKSFKDHGITAETDDDIENLLSRMLLLKDGTGDALSRTGYGIQFLLLVTLSILDSLQNIIQQRGERGVFTQIDGDSPRRSISLVIGLDEPEIHLHPHMQRSLIKYLNSILANSNSEFALLVKELFDIDSFIGQIIVVTHSPNILLDDEKQLVRFYKEDNKLKVLSTANLELGEELLKHLHLNFPEYKEAFFSRSVVFIEGMTEAGFLPIAAERLKYDFDDLGIAVIQVQGKPNVLKMLELSKLLKVNSFGFVDSDYKQLEDDSPSNLHCTDARDFEGEIASTIDLYGEKYLKNIFLGFESNPDRKFQPTMLNKVVGRYRLKCSEFAEDIDLVTVRSLKNDDALKAFYIAWMTKQKTFALGRHIARLLPAKAIPETYQNFIELIVADAKEKS